MYGADETGDTRPFKVFVSLLDRWEIGGPVTEALVVDALTALKNAMERIPNNDDVRPQDVSLARPEYIANLIVSS